MKTDNALRKVLIRNKPDLPYGFENRVMRQIRLEAERKTRRSYRHGLMLVTFVSLIVVAGVFLSLYFLFGFNILEIFAGMRLPELERSTFVLSDTGRSILGFSVYIGALMLVLLGLDHWFRGKMRNSGKD